MTTQTLRRGGLDWNVPQDGKAADAYAVASTALYLAASLDRIGRRLPDGCGFPARHATRLHVISGLLHRLSERQCNEDLACRECDGTGDLARNKHTAGRPGLECKACAGTGSTVGRREKSLEADAQEIASHYGLTCYFQGDPRGCSLYIGEAKDMNDSTYNRGHAIVRLGR